MSATKQRDTEFRVFDADQKNKVPLGGRRNVLITSALPYVNNVPHLGNIIGSVLSADVFSRYCRMREYQSLYICGTDEYGTATEMKALSEGISPQQLCDKFYDLHKKTYDWFSIDFDFFGRTSNPNQKEIAQDIFNKVFANGFTSIDTQMQLHCANCNKFLADRFVNGICPNCQFADARGDQCDGCGHLLDGVDLVEPKCRICGVKPTPEQSRHIFLDLDRLTPQLQSFLDRIMTTSDSRWSANAVAITKDWLKKGLAKRCITRDLQWGTPVPLPEFASKVFYVWFDAPIGYLSITKSHLGDDWHRWWKNPDCVELFNFIGKDNVVFHSIIFPSTLLATNEPFTQPRHICATDFLNYEDQKFSKSRGIGVFGDAVASIGIPSDVLRFYLLYIRPEGQDASFSWDDLTQKVNSELLANLGNFVLRALTFLSNNFDGVQPLVELSPVEHELFAAVDQELEQYTKAMEEVRMRDALQHIMAISRKGNQYMQAGQPWVLVKGTAEERKRAETIVGVSANLSVLLSVLLYPFMPNISAQIQQQCNLPKNIVMPEHFVLFLKAGHKHNKPFALFTKIEPAKVAEWKELFGSGKQQQNQPKNNGPTAVSSSSSKKTQNTTEKQKQKKKKENMAAERGEVGQIYAEVMAKFEKAKALFVTNESEKLDTEIAALKEQITEQKARLGFSGPLFSPPTPKATPPATVVSPAVSSTQTQPKLSAASNAGKEQMQQKQQPKQKKPQQQQATAPADDSVDVGCLDLRVGRIIEAQKHPDADALYVEQIDLGEEKPRTVVSGLVRFVPLEQLKNRLVVCLCNLKPAKMRGVESQAMVMCASTPEKVEVLEVSPDSVPGDLVVCEPFVRRPPQQLNPKKKIWETVAPDLSVSETGECIYKGQILRVERSNSSLSASTLRNVPVK
ncbi:hypothetical protein niasHS_009682 [Heterodera schachtii]|uniref:Methionine--tRNA ligase, cytoplasmic n=2 Tax=Heterodera TaxID=34509 RepID=A0ABD2J3N1_HETSC